MKQYIYSAYIFVWIYVYKYVPRKKDKENTPKMTEHSMVMLEVLGPIFIPSKDYFPNILYVIILMP